MPPARRSRGPWAPAAAGPYRLPREVADRLSAALASYKNRDAAHALAVFLARFWSTPRRLVEAFPIDRRALADHAELGLTEARVRGAIATLEEIGFLDRQEAEPGRRYQRTEEGLHRRAMSYRFGSEYGTVFAKANRAAQAARGARPASPRPVPPPAPPRPSTALQIGRTDLAHNHTPPGRGLIMGEQREVDPLSPLEEALERLRRGVGA
ncbi:hypothetical protein [Methylobacterium sp. WSM2598]|uniref:hypothetical protein n=1 Tax=Methylobacterium sp. WSM2598 TaxID=398261 RepID=UPI00039ED276|nr:hypothetical protein [Methylobacterium sp. WSM2598]